MSSVRPAHAGRGARDRRLGIGAPFKSAGFRPLIQGLNVMIRKRLRTPRAALASCAALLLPFLASADSQMEGSSAHAALKAEAHLDFKIVIPRVLSMDIDDSFEGVHGGQTVAIYTNSHNATLAATLPVSEQARGNIILSSAARKVIAQNVYCAPGTAPYARVLTKSPPNHEPVVCTASMP
jgi:hypothetical protein